MSDSTTNFVRTGSSEAMRSHFHALADGLIARLEGDEILICGFEGEDSDFIRFNRGEIRQAGSVEQRSFTLQLAHGQKHTTGTVSVTGDPDIDRARLGALLGDMRDRLPLLPEDPYLNYATEVNSTENQGSGVLPDAREAVADIEKASAGRDLVGIYAQGDIYAGLVNSLGQRNWYDTRNFNFDWSFYHASDKAVKTAYAGFDWDADAFARKVDLASRQLKALARKPRTIKPGRYRVYLTPAAVSDILELLSWDGFGLKALQTRQTPLLKLTMGEAALDQGVTLLENTAEGIAPDFQGAGFIRPPVVPLVEQGRHVGTLISPRSAKEYGVATNGAGAMEMPESLEMAAGRLPHDQVLTQLDTGVYIGNVWYLNYSDRTACRTTGMTRFATFWIENGEVQGPLNVMRFDETLYRMLGENLAGLTNERELHIDPGTYEQRATTSSRTPGALVEDFNFTL